MLKPYLFIFNFYVMNTLTDNRVQLIGFLGQDVDLRELTKGYKLARLSLATSEFKKAPNGQTISGKPLTAKQKKSQRGTIW